MSHPSRPDDESRVQTLPEDSAGDALYAAILDVLLSSNHDKLARHLGLPHAELIRPLLDNGAALDRLTQRLVDGCAGLSLEDAITTTRSVLGEAALKA